MCACFGRRTFFTEERPVTAKRKLVLICVAFFILIAALGLAACDSSNNTMYSTYYWYDADNTLLHEETIDSISSPTDYPLPKDTDKWNYTEWRSGDNQYEKVAYRVPKNSYFVGNVFQIIVQDLGGQPIKTGSAFVFTSDGWFITNAHVMKDAYYAQAIFNIPNESNGESYTYLDINSGTYYHADKDIYIGKVENYSSIESHYKEIDINQTYEIGDTTYSVGYPLSSIELEVNKGEVTESWSDLYEKLYSGNSYICSSSYIAPGSSGGILTNENLEVIGITTLGWTDYNDEFIVGASISAFNFNNILLGTSDDTLQTLQDRFHKDEKVFINYFNSAKLDAEIGSAEKGFIEDGVVAYVYEWKNEGTNDNDIAFSWTDTLLIGENGLIVYTSEYYWATGDRRTEEFYGVYDNQRGLDNFIYEFKFEWDDGDYYTVKSTDINYSTNVSLTLNKYEVGHSYSYTPTDENITYAKEMFNSIYEWLTEDIGIEK